MQKPNNIEEQVLVLLQKTASNGKLSKKQARLLVDVVKSQLEIGSKARKQLVSKQFVRDALLLLSIAKDVIVTILHQ